MDDWFDENWAKLKEGGANSFIRMREFYRRNPAEIEKQEERWRAAEQAEDRLSSRSTRQESEEPGVPAIWDGPPPDPEAEQLWRAVLGDLQMQLPRPTFETWLKPTVGVAIETGDGDVFIVRCPTAFAAQWLERRMFQALQRTLEKVAGSTMELRLTVGGPTADDQSI